MLSVLMLVAMAHAQEGPAPDLGVPKEPAVISFAGRGVDDDVDVVTVTLTTAQGEETVIELHDDGVVPDRVKDDGLFMGTSWFSGEAATARVQVGERSFPPIDVPFQKGITAPVAHFTLNNDVLAVEIDSPGLAAEGGSGKAAKGSKGDKSAGKTSGKARGRGRLERIRRNQAKTVRGGDDTPIYLLAGVSVLATLAMGVLLFRGRGSSGGGGDPMAGLVPQPEPGLLGGRLPSLSAGLSVWVGAPAQHTRLRDAALRTLAAHRRVLVVAPAGTELPAVRGHSVYRATSVDVDGVDHDMRALLRAQPVPIALLVAGLDADTMAELVSELAADLPAGTGGVVISDAPVTGLPALRFEAQGEDWRVDVDDRHVRVAAGPDGLVPVDPEGGAAS